MGIVKNKSEAATQISLTPRGKDEHKKMPGADEHKTKQKTPNENKMKRQFLRLTR